jgi:hypothetical protein
VVVERKGTTLVYSLNVSAAEEAIGALIDVLHVGRVRGR